MSAVAVNCGGHSCSGGGGGARQRRVAPQRRRQPPRQKAPRKKQPRQRMPKRGRRLMDPGDVPHYDAFNVSGAPQPLSFSVAPAAPLNGLSDETATSHTSDQKIVLFNPMGGYYIGGEYSRNAGVPTTLQTFTSNGMGLASGGPSASSPAKMMWTRFSVRMRNVTKVGDQSGTVRVLRVASGFPWADPPTLAQFDALATYVKSHRRHLTLPAAGLSASKQWNCIPTDQSQAHQFFTPGTTMTHLHDTLDNPGFTTLVILLEPVGNANTFDLTIATSAYARYEIAGPLANTMRAPRTVPAAIVNRMRDHEEAKGSHPTPVSQEATAQALFNDHMQRSLSTNMGILKGFRRAFTGESTGNQFYDSIVDMGKVAFVPRYKGVV